MNELTKTEIIKTYDHPLDAITGGRYMDSQQVTNRHSEIEQDERDVQRIRDMKSIGLPLMFMFALPALVVFLAYALGGR
jgi:hypothetical protein